MKQPLIGFTFESADKQAVLANALQCVGAQSLPLIQGQCSPGSLQTIQGLLLGGGPDIDPCFYGEERHALTGCSDQQHDRFEIGLVRHMYPLGIPIFGICRGMQIINVALGGTLVQHVDCPERHHHKFGKEDFSAIHAVTLAPARLRIATNLRRVIVNSRHHQAVDRLADGLQAAAFSDDGLVEALVHPNHPHLLAVQWHPEDRLHNNVIDNMLFESFVERAKGSCLRLTTACLVSTKSSELQR